MSNPQIKGITVEIGGNTAPLDKALNQIKVSSKDLQTELRFVNSALKFDPTNVDLLKQKQQLLTKSTKDGKTAISEMRKAQKSLDEQNKSGTITKDQYTQATNRMQREISVANKKLEEQEEALKKCNPQLEAAAAKMTDFGNKSTQMGKDLAPLSAMSSAAATGLVTMAVKAGQSADDLNTMSKQTGLSTEALQKFKYATDIIDVPLETLTGSMSKLTKNMATAQKGTGDAARAFKTLKVDITDGHGALRDNEDVFNDTIKALGKVTNETERDAMAMQIFGKSAQDLNPLILGGADALKQLGDEAQASGLILSQEALDGANEFNDSIDTIKATTMGTMLEVGTTLAEALIPTIETLTDALKGGAEWLRSLDADTLNIIVTIALVVAALAPALILIGQISTGLGALSGVLTFLAANPIVLVIAAVALLVAGFIYLWNTSEEFRNFFIEMGEDIAGAFTAVGDFFVDLFTEKIPGALQTMQDFFTGVFDALADIAKKPINGIIELLNGAIEGINFLIGGINSLTIDMPDWMPDWLGGGQTLTLFSIPEIPTIPLLAKGGILSEGQAIVAEAGPEMIQMLGGKAVVTPLSSSAKNTPAQAQSPVQGDQKFYINVQGIKQLDEVVNWYTHRRQAARAAGEGVI